jgi:hypothetical protein
MRMATIQGPLEIGVDYHRYVPAAKMDQAASPEFDYAEPHNIGDWFITKAIDRLLDYEELFIIRRDAADCEWDWLNRECDAVVLKGGSYIEADWLTRWFGIELFRKIRIPIVLVGAGLQAGVGQGVKLCPEEIEILRYIHDSCAYSSVRGNRTAEALESIGIHNFIVTACPTTYWSRRPEVAVRPPSDDCAGFSYRQWLYSRDPAVPQAQFRAVETVRDQFRSTIVILQGEEVMLQRYLEARRWGAEYEAWWAPIPGGTLARLTRKPMDSAALATEIHHAFDHHTRPAFLDWLMNNTFFSYDIGEFLALYRACGMVVGCRLHSNLVALANGTPTVFLTYDERTKELAELLDAPHCALSEFGPDFDLFGQDWRPFEKSYRVHYAEMRRFLDANGLPHRLVS